MATDLKNVMQYQNENIVRRFMETWDVPYHEALDLFEETKKWIWLIDFNHSQPNKEDHVHMAVSQSIKLIDEMWHTFVLFTVDYTTFCNDYFGHYIHHRPAPKAAYEQQLASFNRDPEAHIQLQKQDAQKQYTLIYNQLGEETLVKWFKEYLERYTDERLQQLWRWSFSPYDVRVESSLAIAELKSVPRHQDNTATEVLKTA